MNKERLLDQIRGSLFGGAIGDALGYAVEFDREPEIFGHFGKDGITEYELKGGKALISDDTQMTLFTADGILKRAERGRRRGIAAAPRHYVRNAYLDWLKTQRYGARPASLDDDSREAFEHSWLLTLPEMYAQRAPGMTCLNSLNDRSHQEPLADYIANPLNNSKGCGGIMRIAPLALFYKPGFNWREGLEQLDLEAAQLAAITHGNSLGYMPAAVVNHVISRCLTDSETMTLKEIVLDARDSIAGLFAGDRHLPKLLSLIDKAILLSGNDASDLDNLHLLGEGWVAEETLAVALYCALKYQNDFSKAIIVSVNHDGDSDSTGAVTGNILGALTGYDAIDAKWKENLELNDVLMKTADELYRYGFGMNA